MREIVVDLYAVNEHGEVCLSLPRAIAALEEREDPEAALIASWLGICLALAEEWRPDQAPLVQSSAMGVAAAVVQVLEEAPDHSLVVSSLRLANLCGLSWGGNHGTAQALRRLTGVQA